MKEKIKSFFAVCVLVLAVPYIITLLFQGNKTSMESSGITGTQEESKNDSQGLTQTDFSAVLQGAGVEKDMDIEGYLVGIVAKEIPLDYEFETIKAQAVIARTSLTAALEAGGDELPESLSREEMMELWGQNGFEENYRILETAVKDTQGEILTYEGMPIKAAFHAVSAGKTRSAQESYLSSVESEMDIPSPDYLNVTFMEKNDFINQLKASCPEAAVTEENVMETVTVEERDDIGYALQVKIGEKTVTGEEFRSFLDLNSACFYIKEVEGKIRIVTKGLGHGLGFSQYGANELAKEGKNYKEILSYYYKNVEIS